MTLAKPKRRFVHRVLRKSYKRSKKRLRQLGLIPSPDTGSGDDFPWKLLRGWAIPRAPVCDTYFGVGHFAPSRTNDAAPRTFLKLIGAPAFGEVDPKLILSGKRKGYLLCPLLGGSDDIHDILMNLPSDWIHALRRKETGLIIDHSREGLQYTFKRPASWHGALRKLEVEPSQIIYVSQNRHLSAQYKRWQQRNNVTDAITIIDYDYHIRSFFHRSMSKFSQDPDLLKSRIERFESRETIEKTYLCLNFKPRPWRIALLTRLLRDELWDEGLISFGGLEMSKLEMSSHSQIWRDGGPVSQFMKLRIASETAEFIPDLVGKGQIYFDSDESVAGEFGTGRTHDMDSTIFARSGFSLVTETEMHARKRRITEKPLKALANSHPFVLFGNYRSLDLVRELGFQTYGRWIDERYDTIANPTERFREAYRAFLEFREESRERILNDKGLRETIIANTEHTFGGVTQLYKEVIDPKVRDLITQALPL